MKSAIAAIFFVAVAGPALAQMSPVGLWRNVDDKTGEVKAEIRIADSGGALAGRIEKTLKKDAKPDATCDECDGDRASGSSRFPARRQACPWRSRRRESPRSRRV